MPPGGENSALVYNSGNKTNCGASGQNDPCYSYYSWIAATLGGKQADGSTDESRGGYNAAASICPKGWRLPTSTTSNNYPTYDNNWKTGDWYALAIAYGADLNNSYYDKSANFYVNAGPDTTPNFLLAGYQLVGSLLFGGESGYYWSASVGDSSVSAMSFDSSFVYSAGVFENGIGASVRCLAK